jgi:hypothetical protein
MHVLTDNYRTVTTNLATGQQSTRYGSRVESHCYFNGLRPGLDSDVRASRTRLELAEGNLLVQWVDERGFVSDFFYSDTTSEPEQLQPLLTITRTDDFTADVEKFINLLQIRENDHTRGMDYKENNRSVYTFTEGPKYTRVCRDNSAYAFLDKQGNIYKPAGYKGPAKHVRGNIYGANALAGTGIYSVDYLR